MSLFDSLRKKLTQLPKSSSESLTFKTDEKNKLQTDLDISASPLTISDEVNSSDSSHKNNRDSNVILASNNTIKTINKSDPSYIAQLFQKGDFGGVCTHADLSKGYSNNIFEKIIQASIEEKKRDRFYSM